MRSRERHAALKRDGYTCKKCGAKQSRAKGKEVFVCVHHSKTITGWEDVIDLIYKEILVNPDDLETLCVSCHDSEHK